MNELFQQYFSQIIGTAVAVVMLPLVKFTVRKVARKVSTALHKTRARERQVRYVVGAVLNTVFVIVLVTLWGVEPQNLLVWLSGVAAFFGVALFSRRSILSNITAGVIMFFSAPYHVGGTVKIIDKDTPIDNATIEKIGSFYTRIRTSDGEMIVIPNHLFMQKMVGIKSH